ncbi:hypothetical protein K2173_015958 [Erythroxylum novogranatense]|uniref:Uncharacterized protein n=1 Tax=Erythroxylum novogranatense TaxID=1862640 RepID=A0AAV8SEX7_9ROSI|nr:hypothetical protein K2173_015958 [Erythroxylum novogranatense]
MKREALAWLLLAVFFLVLSHFVCESSATPKHSEITRATQLKDLYRSKEGDEQRRVTGLAEANQVKRISEKAGRGVYAGGDMLRPRAKKRNGADPLLLKSSSVLSTILRQVVGLLLLGVFS